MAAANPEKRREVRRLVEEDGLSMREAAERAGAGERSVIRWQAQDAAAGDPWALAGEASARAKAKADAMSDDERKALTERARLASAAKWENRRRAEADAAGVAASTIRVQMLNTLPRLAASLLEEGTANDTEGLRPQRLGALVKSLVVSWAVALDKADRLSGIATAPTEIVVDAGDWESEVAEAGTLLADIRRRRQLRAV